MELTGTWRLDDYRVEHPDGSSSRPLGPDPIGLGIYTDDGNVSAHLMSRDGTAYVGYSGTYRFDQPTATVTHTVRVASDATRVGTDLTRTVARDGDQLELRPPPSTDQNGTHRPVLTWRRIDSAGNSRLSSGAGK